jgi:inositol oxygenase
MDTIFRDYSNVSDAVKENYLLARTNQTVEFVDKMVQKYSTFDKKIKIWDILDNLNTLIDVSDPDMSLPNIEHAYQTAEKIRQDGHPDWMQLVGLIHDMGKIMYLKGTDETGTGKKKAMGNGR